MEQIQCAFQVLQAKDATVEQTNKATEFLQHFQKTIEAWSVADELLGLPSQGSTLCACVFAAQTLRIKIQYNWNELLAFARVFARFTLVPRAPL